MPVKSSRYDFAGQELPLRQGSQTFELWSKPPVQPMLKVYFFNVTNHKDFLENGAKLHVKEIGPYVYSEKWEKVDPVWHPNGTLSYRTVKNFTFEPELSFGSEADSVLLPNLPMLAAVSQMGHSTKIVKKAVSTILDVLKMEPFSVHTVKELLWGYDDPLLKLAKGVLPADKRFPYDQFGFFVGKNNTPSEVYTVLTGREELVDFAKIKIYGGKDNLGVWGTPDCNAIKGSDGTGFPAMLTENSTVFIYQPDFCRSLELRVKNRQPQKHEGFETLRFQPADHVFGSVEDYPENKCYCENAKCAPRGVFNVSHCQFNSPVFLSWPHFLNADPKLSENIVGLNPKPELHTFYVDIQPKLGLAMQAKGRVQINIQMSKVDEIPQTANLTDLLIPIVWFEDGIEQLPPVVLGLLRQAISMPEVAEAALSYILFVIGGLLIVGGIMYFIKYSYGRTNKLASSTNHPPHSKVDTFPVKGEKDNEKNGVNGKHQYSNSVEMEDKVIITSKDEKPKNGLNKEVESAMT
ncbi:scavenger receptor class B member 1 isoform X2 [Folsomia candida]|uniref:scavenger receptor class B member 1 isoform X2 n=1 Tax=Folsomia candida TaxID=158441 RepID=UPI0016052D2E|nr:scavenger receptor class B member 1 isoform X2 [Folsomia candida]